MPRVLLLTLIAALLLAGCGLDDDDGGGDVPRVGVSGGDEKGAAALGFPVTGTKNTTRVGGSDPVADAAGVANAVFPASSSATRPQAVALVEKDAWQAAVAGAVLSAEPIGAPLLLSDGDELPAVTSETLDRLEPPGHPLAKDAQVVLVGDTPQAPDGRKSARIPGKDPYRLAAEIDKFHSSARGDPSGDVIVTSGERAEFAMPAASWAAYSGDSVLFAKKDELPGPTRAALEAHEEPDIFLLGPESAIGPAVEEQLGELGKVTRIAAETPVENAIELVRFQGRGFGWGFVRPGHNFVLANTERPMDAAAAAALARNGVFAPLLLTDSNEKLSAPLESYLLDIQPGFEADPNVTAGSNYVWILGDESALNRESQGRLDEITELIPVDYGEPERGDDQPDRPAAPRQPDDQ